jgi:Negative regulator of sigma E activity
MMLKNRFPVLYRGLPPGILSVFLLFTIPALAAESDTTAQAQQLINAMSRATRTLNYDGIFVYRHGSRMDTMRIIHKANGNREHERMVSLTGFAREVIRDGETVTCIFSDNQAVMVEKSRPKKFIAAQLPEPIERIADYYGFSVGGKDRVAGRSTWVVNIVPRDDYRYGYQLWIDEETRLLLKSELKDDSGWPVEQILFTHIEILPDIPEQLLNPAISGKGYTWYSSSAAEMTVNTDLREWQVTSLPRGFILSNHEKQTMTDKNVPVEHMVYSDGLAMVSVFIEKIRAQPEEPVGASKLGGVNAFATYTNGYQVTAVGEVPQKTVRLMADSVIQGQ